MPDLIKVCFKDGHCRNYKKGTSLLTISKDVAASHKSTIMAAKINNDIKDLNTKLTDDSNVDFYDLSTELGNKVYQRNLIFILVLATRELFPNARLTVEHSLSKGVYCELHLGRQLTGQDIEKLETRMRRIVEEDRPIVKKRIPVAEAIRLFEEVGDTSKIKLLKQLKHEYVNIYFCGDGYDYFYRTMVPSTGYIKVFEIKYYPPGFILRFPEKENPHILPEFVEMPKLSRVFLESERWAKIIECDYIGTLNEYIEKGEINNIVRIAEGLHEKKIAEIADYIYEYRDRLRLVLIAGPSSSGKTTFTKRLAVQMRVNGIKSLALSTDDYFFDRDLIQAGTEQEVDLESLDIVDLELFNDHLTRLLQGEEIEIPYFDFPTGKRVFRGNKIRLEPDQFLIIEGIHGLNDKLTQSIPRIMKVKIYINALTQIAIDQHNRFPTTDTRLIRRIVRDSQFRSSDALSTLRGWASVRRGEEGNIYPYAEQADIMFNSALIYEMPVLKNFAIPLLEAVGPEHEEYSEARRLIRLLNFFFPVSDAEIPLNSILREFLGNYCTLINTGS